MTGKKPIHTIRAGGATASVWENESERDGARFKRHSVVIERSFKTGDSWKTTNSFDVRDLRAGIAHPKGGAVVHAQRFGSALNLNLYFHALVLDGVYADHEGRPVFHDVEPPLRLTLDWY